VLRHLPVVRLPVPVDLLLHHLAMLLPVPVSPLPVPATLLQHLPAHLHPLELLPRVPAFILLQRLALLLLLLPAAILQLSVVPRRLPAVPPTSGVSALLLQTQNDYLLLQVSADMIR
jgi:hypothetical protein